MNNTSELSAQIQALFVGEVENRWPDKPPSAIGKMQTKAVLHLEENGFVEDSQADLKVHGGLEKAVHHYAAEHLEFWKKKFPEHAQFFVPGCFGENISTNGIDEHSLCLGDILTMGTATVQICQGRQPCWKLNAHSKIDAMASAFQKSARTGWYYRVLANGQVRTGDFIGLVERPNPSWSLNRLITARFNPNLSMEDAIELSNLETLSASWRAAFQKKQNLDFKENTDTRLIGKNGSS